MIHRSYQMVNLLRFVVWAVINRRGMKEAGSLLSLPYVRERFVM